MENFDCFAWVILPLLIALARIIDVSIGTIRIVLLAKGNRTIAPILGFFEVIIWLLSISQIMQNLDNIVSYIAYGAGFAAGNWIGLIIEDKLALGDLQIRVITKKTATELIQYLKKEGYGITSLKAQGARGDVNIFYTIIHRKDLKKYC